MLEKLFFHIYIFENEQQKQQQKTMKVLKTQPIDYT
jgi:hypothetical protein